MGIIEIGFALRAPRRPRTQWPSIWRKTFGALVALMLLAVALPAVASAAECTNTWKGGVEGAWTTAANWSAGHVPTETEVACIGSGKTVNVSSGTNKVGVVQGEGSLKISESTLELANAGEFSSINTLTMASSGILTGAGTLEITNSLAWKNQSTMSGSGTTVIASGATATTTMELEARLKKRRFVNEGTFTMTSGKLEESEGAAFENLGTFNANSTSSISGAGGATFANSGTFQRTATGTAVVTASFENKGTAEPKKGSLEFQGGGSSSSSNQWNAPEGTEIRFSNGTYALSGGSLSGAIGVIGGSTSVSVEGATATTAAFELKEGTLSVPKSLTLKTLTMASSGILTGAGTLEITNSLAWKNQSTMSGSGTTVIASGATATTTMELEARLKKRRFVNEGTFTMTSGKLEESEGAAFENLGTFNANTSSSLPISTGSGSTPTFVNTGTFSRTVTGNLEVSVFFENNGTVKPQKGSLEFTGGGSSSSSNQWNAPEGTEIRFAKGTYTLSGGSLSGSFRFSGTSTSVSVAGVNGTSANVELKDAALSVLSGSLTLNTLKMDAYEGRVSGAGTLKIASSLAWEKMSTMSGVGSTVILSGATATTSMELEALVEQRLIVNEGTFTMNSGTLAESEGARFENLGTFNANSTAAKSLTSIGGSTFFNNGTFQKTSGTNTTAVEGPFENGGVIRETTGHLKITNPVTVSSSNHFGKRCKTGDPVDCATGDFSESESDIAIGGRGIGLVLVRSYSAQAAAVAGSPGPFGYGWTSSFGDHLVSEESGKKITVVQGNSSTVPFTESGKGTFTSAAWSQDTLSGSAESGYTFTSPEQTKYVFSGTGKLEAVTDRNGNKTTLAYNKSGQLETITDPVGRYITLTYNGEGLVESAKDPMGHTVKYGYESKNLVKVTEPGEASPRWQFGYDGSHRITSITNGRGGKTTNEYDASSRVKSQTDPAGRTLAFEYSSFHTTITNKATGSVTDEWFTSNYEPFSITRGYGTAGATTETFSYNAAGQLVGVTDGNGHTTAYGYDSESNRTSEKDAAGNETKWSFNKTHDVISTTTPRGETTTIKRDGNGNVESVSRPGPEKTTQISTFGYDKYGQLESVTDPLKRTWTYVYDGYGDRTSETDPLGDTQTLGYDEDSRVTSIVTPRGNVEGAKPSEYEQTIERDAQGRPKKATDPLGHATEYAYDGNGNLEAKTDANGHTTKYAYNADDEQTKVENPSGAILETGYDGAGEVTSQTDANKHTTTYVRNAQEEPTEVIDPLGRKTIEEFDAAGNLKAVIDPAERKTSYSYDKANRLTEVNYSEEATLDVKFEYDADSNMTNMVDGTGESIFKYDQLGRLTESKDGHGDVVGYGYDLAEELTGIAYPNGKSISRVFDGAGRLESVTDWLGGMTTFAYDADSELEGITFPAGSGNVDEYAYDRADRVSEATFTKGVKTLASLSYGRGKIGEIEKEIVKGLPGPEERTYGYDKNDRLAEAGAASFEYDAVDNLTKAPGTINAYDAASQLESGTGVSYSYDKLGERIKATPSGGPATTYKYDQADNLISVERPEEGKVPAISESFAYDGSGLMASKTSGLTTRRLSWDSSAALPLLLDDGQNSYIYGPGGLPVEQVSSEEESTYLHHDQLGSTRLLTNSGGESSATFSYAPYGGLEGSTGIATTPLGFAGQYTDAPGGLQYLRARFYDPTTAQFMTRDPLAAVTRAPYAYGKANPTAFIDPSGLGPCILGVIACDESDDPCDSILTGPLLPACLIPEEDAQTVVNASAGLGDELLSPPIPGIDPGPWAREQLGINNVEACTMAYSAGRGLGMFANLTRGIAGGADMVGKYAPRAYTEGRAASRGLNEKFVHVRLP